MKISLIAACAACFVVPVLGAVTAAAAPQVVAPASTAAAIVNGEIIPAADLDRLTQGILAEQNPPVDTSTTQGKQIEASVRQSQLENMITTRLLAQEAARRKVVAKASDVDDAVDAIRANFKTEAEFNSWLALDNKTESDIRKAIADELAIRLLSAQLTVDVTVTNDDIATYYRANLDKFATPEEVKAHHILLAVNPGSPPAEKERVRKRALDLIRQLNNGADFVALAKANSDDGETKESGGDLGTFGRGMTVKPFEDAAFSAPVGKIVGPVETEFGFHILRVDAKIPASTISLADVQATPEMRAFLLKVKVKARLDQEVAALKKAGRIVVNG